MGITVDIDQLLNPRHSVFSEKQRKILLHCDRAMVGCLYILIFFLPISNAIIDSAAFAILPAFLVKRGIIYSVVLRQYRKYIAPPSIIRRFLIFLKSLKPIKNVLNGIILLMAIVILFNLFLNHLPFLGIRKFVSRFSKEILLYFVFIETINSPARFYRFLSVLLLSFMLVMSDAIFQHFTKNSFVFHHPCTTGRVDGPSHLPNDLGTYVITILPFCLGLLTYNWMRFRKKDDAANFMRQELPLDNKWIISILFFLAMCVLGLTFSRSAWMGFLFAVLFLILTDRDWKGSFLKAAIFVCFFVIFSNLFAKIRTDIFHAPNLIYQEFFNFSPRLVYWDSALKVIQAHPILGSGYGQYVLTLKKMNLGPFEYPHNCYLHMAAEIGLVGLAVFGMMMIRFFHWTLRRIRLIPHIEPRMIVLGLLAGLFAFLVDSFSDTAFTSLKLSTLMWIMMGSIVALQRIETEKSNHPLEKGKL